MATYTQNQNNKGSDANRVTLSSVRASIQSEVARATSTENNIRNNLASMISSSIDEELSGESANPVENRAIAAELAKKESGETELAEVAYTGSYNSMTDLPTIPPAPTVDSILSSVSENAVGNKWVKEALDARADASALKAVATSGSYNDLSDKPDLSKIQKPYVIIPNRPKQFSQSGSYVWTGWGETFTVNGTFGVTNWYVGSSTINLSLQGWSRGSYSGFGRTSNFTNNEFVYHSRDTASGMPEGWWLFAGAVEKTEQTSLVTRKYTAVMTFVFDNLSEVWWTPIPNYVWVTPYVYVHCQSTEAIYTEYPLKATRMGEDYRIYTAEKVDVAKQVDIFPLLGSERTVCSHGAAQFVGARDINVAATEAIGSVSSEQVSNIRTMIGTRTGS